MSGPFERPARDSGPERRGISRPGLVAAVCLLVAAAADPGSAGERSHLLLLTIDTLRADSLGVNGAASGATPNLDRLARSGVNFVRARSPVPLTLPAHASILTGLDPPSHGVRDNATDRLGGEHLTLAEALAARGYETAAFVSSFVLDRRFGLAQGFELYDDRVAGDAAELERVEAERAADEVLAAFTGWLERRRPQRPFFAWVHLYDPHAPYEPPEPWASRFAADPYAGEVAFADDVVGRLLAALAARDLRRRTVVAVAGDHGEGLGEHGEATHALFIYNSTLHVPMLLSAPGRVPGNVVVGDLVRLIDLAPTLLDYLGLPASLGEGVSLRPWVEAAASDGAAPPARALTAYGESLYGRLHLGWSALYGLESGPLRFILAPRPELYDLAADPGETTDLLPDQAARAEPLRRELRRRVAAERQRGGLAPGAGPDPQTVARLRALGYLAGSDPAPAAAVAADPKAKLDVWRRLQRAMAEYQRGDDRAAAATLEELATDEPDLPLLYDYLGAAYQRLGQPAAAERSYRRAVERGVATAAMHAELGLLLARRGELRQAETILGIAADLDPASVVARHRLGDVQRRSGRPRQAAASYRQALEINPDYVWAWNGLGMSLAAAGDDDGSLAAFRRAVELAPRAPQGLFNLALQLERMERPDEAVEIYSRVVELARNDPERRLELDRATAAIRRLAGAG